MSGIALNRIGMLNRANTPGVNRGVSRPFGGEIIAKQSYSTDAVGVFSLTLSGVVVGSAIQVQAANGAPIFNGVASSSVQLVPLLAYAPGSPLNDLRIKVRKGSSAPFFRPWDSQAVAISGAQTIFVSQIPDE